MDKDLNILYEDNHVIVVLKPQGVPSCGDESGDDSLLEMVRRYLKVTYDKPGNVYVGLVHRLDRPTGGVMVFAKTSKAAARLSAQMKEGDFEKKYLAVLVGTPKESSATVVNYLKKNPLNNMVYICTQTEVGRNSPRWTTACWKIKLKFPLSKSNYTRGARTRSACRWRGFPIPCSAICATAERLPERAIWRCGRIRFPLPIPLPKSA